MQTTERVGNCDCLRHLYCGHCMSEDRHTHVPEDQMWCKHHGQLTGKDVIIVYPEGHNH